MAQESKISTPTAILMGSVIVAIGVFFGLRGRSEVPPAAPAPTATSAAPAPNEIAPQTSSNGPSPEVRTEPAPPPRPVDGAAATKEAAAIIQKHKKMFTEKCLAPSLATKPEPKNVKLTLNFTFDTNGKVISRGISEDRQTSRPDVTQCVNRTLPEILISPQGNNVYVEVPLELP